jgi:hypothetical protein
MNKLFMGLATVPLMYNAAFAGQLLNNKQMDAVTAGFAAFSTSLAESFGGVIASATSNLAETSALRTNPTAANPTGTPVTTPTTVLVNGAPVTLEVSLNEIKSVSAAQSVSTAANLPSLQPIAGGIISPVAGPRM